MCEYYDLEKNPGLKLDTISEENYSFLDESNVRKKLLEFDSDDFARVRFYVPAIHCVSCIWLLENLQKIKPGILRSEVNFSGKRVSIDFKPGVVKLSEIAALMASLGYAPKISLGEEEELKGTKRHDNKLIIKLAVAAFCFGNVMLLSFPEYLGLDSADQTFQQLFSWLNIGLALPVVFYSGSDYFSSALRSFRQRQINIDVPIAVGLLVLFSRSLWEIFSGFGPGYLDSLTGLVFFLLIGRWFQDKTYESLAFDRDFKSYFPLAVQKLSGQEWKPVVVYELVKGDAIRIRNLEIIPADSILISKEAYVDYSFVTGESRPVLKKEGELVYAGGRLIGQPVELVVEHRTSQSHLTSLWNHEAFQKPMESRYKKMVDHVAQWFTWTVLGIAILCAVYWSFADSTQIWLTTTAVLMVACPCALALTAPFTYGNMLRVFGKQGLYLKNADIIERMAAVDTVVFDKTGTITHEKQPQVQFHGVLSSEASRWVKQLTGYSTHPLSKLICRSIREGGNEPVTEFKEIPGKGIEANIDSHIIRIGSASFTGSVAVPDTEHASVYVSVDGYDTGYFSVRTSVRENIKGMLGSLENMHVALLSGDNETDKTRMLEIFPPASRLLFNLGPHDKLSEIRNLQGENKTVMMLGDGLNDSGALKQSDVGIAVTDDTGVFTPASDGILVGDKIGALNKFLSLAKDSTRILKIAFILSFFYNIVAIGFAVSGHLTPLIAAVLMPVSSISVVIFSTVAVNWAAAVKKI